MVDGVSVVIPAHNRAELIRRAVTSAIGQSTRPLEVIVVDDASTDDTAAAATAAGADVIVLSENAGPGGARNAGLARATGEWIAFLDSDDEWAPDHLSLLLSDATGYALVTAPGLSADGVRGNTDSRGRILRDPADLFRPGGWILTSGTMISRDAARAVGGFRTWRLAEDLEMWVRVLEYGTGWTTATPTLTYHQHGSQTSLDQDEMRRHVQLLFEEWSSSSWLTPRLTTAIATENRWDALRAAQSEHRWRAVGTDVAWFASRPSRAAAVAGLLRARRARRRRSAECRASSTP